MYYICIYSSLCIYIYTCKKLLLSIPYTQCINIPYRTIYLGVINPTSNLSSPPTTTTTTTTTGQDEYKLFFTHLYDFVKLYNKTVEDLRRQKQQITLAAARAQRAHNTTHTHTTIANNINNNNKVVNGISPLSKQLRPITPATKETPNTIIPIKNVVQLRPVTPNRMEGHNYDPSHDDEDIHSVYTDFTLLSGIHTDKSSNSNKNNSKNSKCYKSRVAALNPRRYIHTPPLVYNTDNNSTTTSTITNSNLASTVFSTITESIADDNYTDHATTSARSGVRSTAYSTMYTAGTLYRYK